MSQGDGFDRVFGTGAPGSKPLDPKAPKQKDAFVEKWTPVPGSPHLEQSNHTPPRLRTVVDPLSAPNKRLPAKTQVVHQDDCCD